MSEIRSRPRFRFRTSLSPETIKERIRARIRDLNPAGFRLDGTGDHLILQYPQSYQHAWTPQMDLDLEWHQEPGHETMTMVRCQIGPSPSIWMLFLGGYIALGFIALLGLTLGMSQQFLGQQTWGYWVALPTPFLAFGLWWLSQEGKRRSVDDMLDLKHFVDASLGCDCFALAEEG